MITLILTKKNFDEPYVLNLSEEDWEFSVRLGSTLSNNDNFLTIANPNRTLSDSSDVIAFYNMLKYIPLEEFGNVILKVDNVEVFNSNDFNFYFLGLFLQYQYVRLESNVTRGSRGNRGLNIFLNFSNYSSAEAGDQGEIIEQGE